MIENVEGRKEITNLNFHYLTNEDNAYLEMQIERLLNNASLCSSVVAQKPGLWEQLEPISIGCIKATGTAISNASSLSLQLATALFEIRQSDIVIIGAIRIHVSLTTSRTILAFNDAHALCKI